MKIFFISGFIDLGDDIYKNLDYLAIADDLTFFYYNRNEKLVDIETRLLKEFNEDKYDWILAHSMGAFFTSRLLAKCLQRQNVCFISPYIQKSMLVKAVCMLPMPYFPNWTYLTTWFDKYTRIRSDITKFKLSNGQLIRAVNRVMNSEAYVLTYKSHNVNIIYGTEDLIARMEPMFIVKLMTCTTLVSIISKHEPFNDDFMIKQNLRRKLLVILSSK